MKTVKINAVTSTKIVNVAPKKEVINYLSEGITGKQMMKSIYESNNAHKQDLGTFSQCLKRAIEFGTTEFKANIKGFDVSDCIPRNLIPLRSEANKTKEKFSVYEVLMLIKRFYATKK
jgi:hypothetical protein